MIIKTFLIFFFTICVCCIKFNNQSSVKNLSTSMQELNIDTALIIDSEAIDDYPLWSTDSKFIAANIEGIWHKYRLTNIKLEKADWHNIEIGIMTTKNSDSLLTAIEQEKFNITLKYDVRKILTSTGDKIELKLGGFSTSLILTKNGQNAKVIWKSSLENCHSLSLSPDEKFIAYLCELNGLFIMKIK